MAHSIMAHSIMAHSIMAHIFLTQIPVTVFFLTVSWHTASRHTSSWHTAVTMSRRLYHPTAHSHEHQPDIHRPNVILFIAHYTFSSGKINAIADAEPVTSCHDQNSEKLPLIKTRKIYITCPQPGLRRPNFGRNFNSQNPTWTSRARANLWTVNCKQSVLAKVPSQGNPKFVDC